MNICLFTSGGTLVFDEADIELRAENILITDNGVMQVWLTTAVLHNKRIRELINDYKFGLLYVCI